MAISKVEISRLISVKVVTGRDANNKDVLKTISFRNVKTSATNENIHAVLTALAGMVEYPLDGLFVTDQSELVGM